MPSIAIFDPVDDLPHQPADDPAFQESSLFVWRDMTSGLSGFWRLGQEPVVRELSSCFGIFTADGVRFRSNVTGVPMSAGDRGETHMGWGRELRVDLDTLVIEADFPDCEASLRFEDFNPRYDYQALIGRPLPDGQTGHHLEVAGRMTGRVRLGDQEVEVNALGYRDRSWGVRHWDTIRSTRWWPVVFGPDLCLHTLDCVLESTYFGPYGYVIRDGEVLSMTPLDVAVTLDSDGIGPRSGDARFVLDGADGTVQEVHHDRDDGILLHVRGYNAIESIGTARWGDRVGMSNLEVSTNPAGGHSLPVVTFVCSDGQGLSRREAPISGRTPRS